MNIGSTFAIIDVKRGRKQLAKHFEERPLTGECPKDFRIPVTITGYLDSQWGNDDGESTEFSMTVESISAA